MSSAADTHSGGGNIILDRMQKDPRITYCEQAAEKVSETVESASSSSFEPVKFALPMVVTIELTSAQAADKLAAREGADRVADVTVQSTVGRQCDVLRYLLDVGRP